MAVAHVADSNTVVDTTGGAPQSTTVTLTVAGGHSNNLLIAVVVWVGSGTVSSVVWDVANAGGQAFTSVGTKITSGPLNIEMFRLVNPTAGTSKLVTATLSQTESMIAMTASHFDGVDQTTPIRAGSYINTGSAASSPVSLNITSQTDDMTVSGFMSDGFQNNPTTNKTLIGASFSGSVGAAIGADYAAGAATNTHTWTEAGSLADLKVLGASLAAATVAFPTTSVIDAFTRANENPLFGNWTNAGAGVDQLKLVSNQVVPSTAGTYNSSTWVNSFGPDFEFYVDVVTAPGTNGTYLAIECAVVREDFDATADGFQVQSRNISGTHTMRLYSIANGSYTQLGSDTSVGGTPQAIGISRSGTTVKAFVKVGGSWAEKISVTDSNYQVPLYPALVTGAADDAVLDNFGGGTVGAGPAGWGRLFGADIHRLVQRVN